MSNDLRLAKLWRSLNDPDQFVKVEKVPVFDAHTEEYHVDSNGKPCAPDAEGAKKVERNFDKKELEHIARVNNRRCKRGELSALTLGHTNPKERDERKQPPIKGYALNYSVDWDDEDNRWMLYSDFYVRKSDYNEAAEYPRTSIELWPGDWAIDPIALLRRTPARPLPQWSYHRQGDREVLRFSRDNSLSFAKGADHMADLPPLPPEDEEDIHEEHEEHDEADETPMHEKLHQYMRHCAKHPHHKAIHEHYARMAGEDDGEDGMMDEEEAPPLQMGAFAAPAATNANMPKTAKGAKTPGKKPAGHAGKAEEYNRKAESIRFSRVEQQNKQMQARLAKLEQEKNEAEGEAIVMRLVGEGFQFKDASKEVLHFAKLDRDGRKEYEQWIRDHLQPAPVGPAMPMQFGRVPLDPTPPSGTPVDLEDNPEGMPLDDQMKVMQYQKAHALWDMPFPEIAARALPHKYGRNGTVAK